MPTWNSSLLTTIATGNLVAVSTYLQPVLDNIWSLEAFYKRPIVYPVYVGALSATSATSYTAIASAILYLIPANVARKSAVYFEVVGYSSSGSYTASFQLTQGGSAVSGSEVTTTATTATRLRSGDLSALLTSTSETTFGVEYKMSSGSGSTFLVRAFLVVVPT